MNFQEKGRRNLKGHSWVPVQVAGLSVGVQHWHVMASRRLSDADDIAVATRLGSAPPMPFPLRVVQRCIHRLYCVASHPRHLSGIARYPAIHDFASSLAQSQPSFAISSEKVHILSHPADFYTRLTDLIRGAERRIFISSLYIGSTETSLKPSMTLCAAKSFFTSTYC